MWKLNRYLTVLFILFLPFMVRAQDDWSKKDPDTAKKNKIDSLLKKPKGLLGELTQNLLADTANEDKPVLRNDIPFQKYENRVIRRIIVLSPKFGVNDQDTSSGINAFLANLANKMHYRSRGWVIRNQLFFKEKQRVSAYLMGNNERYLRDLPFLQDASLQLIPVRGTSDSVDVIVRTKDVLSLGGSMTLRSTQSAVVELKEDNFLGWGDRLQFQTFFDHNRQVPLGIGMVYIKRNILGTFIDGSAGYLNFENAFNTGRREEKVAFGRLVKPLVNPYMRWTYAITAEQHATENMYSGDSIYRTDWKYRYRTLDTWAGYNLTANNTGNTNEFSRLRFLLSARMMDQKFIQKPLLYADQYFYAYTNVQAMLGALSIFKLNFYKTQYVYGFGRKEDLPDGLEANITAGAVKTENRKRLYTAINLQRYFLTSREGFFNYSFSLGSYHFHNKAEDVSMVTSLDYFTRLRQISKTWKQRAFLNVSYSRQFKTVMQEPLFLESRYGLMHFKNNRDAGYMRATVKAESVFFSPWNVMYFRFAPFIFGSATLFHSDSDEHTDPQLYTAVGGGVRTRNESLVFGTIELRAVYYPRSDMLNNRYAVQFNTNLRFKYAQNFIKRPEFVQVN